MILTGKMIHQEVQKGKISIEPFCISHINPNSYNFRIGEILTEINYDHSGNKVIKSYTIPHSGITLKKGVLYLCSSLEKIGSNEYSMRLIGRSSTGRLGLSMKITNDLQNDFGQNNLQLEIYPLIDFVLYPNMKVGQVSFWKKFRNL